MGVRDEAVEKCPDARRGCWKHPDARRVAPISACVSSNTKRYHQTLSPNASSNGGDASRVGAFFNSFVSRRFF